MSELTREQIVNFVAAKSVANAEGFLAGRNPPEVAAYYAAEMLRELPPQIGVDGVDIIRKHPRELIVFMLNVATIAAINPPTCGVAPELVAAFWRSFLEGCCGFARLQSKPKA